MDDKYISELENLMVSPEFKHEFDNLPMIERKNNVSLSNLIQSSTVSDPPSNINDFVNWAIGSNSGISIISKNETLKMFLS